MLVFLLSAAGRVRWFAWLDCYGFVFRNSVSRRRNGPAVSELSSRPNISFFFPVYNDENTVELMTEKAVRVLDDVAGEYEILIIDDGSPDRSGEIADAMAARYERVSVVHHPRNLGYGRAIQTGVRLACRYEWVCFTDGDNQYDAAELYHIVKLLPRYDMVIGFRYHKVYGPIRKLMSFSLNWTCRRLFGTRFRDLTCGLKLVRRDVLDDLPVTCSSPFVGGEIAVRAALKGYHVGEVGIRMYPRLHGDSAVISPRNIWATVRDVWRIRRELRRNAPLVLPERAEEAYC